MECRRPKEDHEKYVKYKTFQAKQYKLPDELEDDDIKELHSFLNCMPDLTGLFLLKRKKNSPKKKWKYSGTGFISKIRRQSNKQCPCPLAHSESNGFHAVVTISTAYHIFNDYEENNMKSFDTCDEIWKDFDTEFKLNYNEDTDSINTSSEDQPSDRQSPNNDNFSSDSDGQAQDNDNISSDSDGQAQDNDNISSDSDGQAQDNDNISSDGQPQVNDNHSSGSEGRANDNDNISRYSDANFSVNNDILGDDADKSSSESSEGIELKELEDLPTLYGYQLLDLDKDLDYKSDWCAIECVTCNESLIESLEETLHEYQTLMSKLYKKAQSELKKNVNLVVVIGHPHTGPKKISFGQTKEFDSVPKRTILKEIRSQQTRCRYSYDNVTCHGSSGSPVFIWGQPITGFGYWFGHPHNHSGENRTKNGRVYGLSTIGVEHVC